MKKQLPWFIAFAFVLCAAAPFTCLGDEIPKAAWRRPLGQPLDHPGVRKNNVDIDDGYWQGAPVGGFGAGTFSRTYRGTFWGRPSGSDPKSAPTFALLECFDYAYYGTLDVSFYGSMPLLKFWPDVDKQVLRQFAATVPREWPELGLWVWKTEQTGEPVLHKRKKKGAVPHDLGVPEGDPFFSVNEPG